MKWHLLILSIFVYGIITFLSFANPLLVFAQTSPILGLGVIGDSNSDEYRADDNRGGLYSSTTLNWLELLIKYKGVYAGDWGTRSSPRRTGYAYNWALSGATTGDVFTGNGSAGSITSLGQDTGLANQIRQGLISDVILYIGSNDFNIWNSTYESVYTYPTYGGLTDAQIQQKVNSIIQNFTQIINTLQTASAESNHPINIITTNFPNRDAQVTYQQTFPNANCTVSPTCHGSRKRVNDVLVSINNQIHQIALDKNVYLIDQYYIAANSAYLAKIIQNQNGIFMQLNGELIDVINNDDEPHHASLFDSHIGTVGSGILVNEYFIPGLNYYGAGLTPFIDAELVVHAGIGAFPTSTPSPSPLSEDVNRDHIVNVTDLKLIITNFIRSVTCSSFICDVNNDGKVNLFDSVLVMKKFGLTW